MFKKLKEFCLFKKEKAMTTTATTDNRTTRQLKQTINRQSTEISKLRTRVSELVDDLHGLRSEISTFKTAVSNDMKGIVEAIKKK
jgi:predicted RNase H-like nuclease (RuvC/YqgF family)|tara:strand:- start:798 stop:1052 length:255 start_codon:yes stop_codon:yes gene_type:complete